MQVFGSRWERMWHVHGLVLWVNNSFSTQRLSVCQVGYQNCCSLAAGKEIKNHRKGETRAAEVLPIMLSGGKLIDWIQYQYQYCVIMGEQHFPQSVRGRTDTDPPSSTKGAFQNLSLKVKCCLMHSEDHNRAAERTSSLNDFLALSNWKAGWQEGDKSRGTMMVSQQQWQLPKMYQRRIEENVWAICLEWQSGYRPIGDMLSASLWNIWPSRNQYNYPPK